MDGGAADHRPAPGAGGSFHDPGGGARRAAGCTISSSSPRAAEPNTCSGLVGEVWRVDAAVADVGGAETGESKPGAREPIGPGGAMGSSAPMIMFGSSWSPYTEAGWDGTRWPMGGTAEERNGSSADATRLGPLVFFGYPTPMGARDSKLSKVSGVMRGTLADGEPESEPPSEPGTCICPLLGANTGDWAECEKPAWGRP